ncbi:hypothetical protein P4G59_13875 [Lactiplantibacillus plantarum]|uniref:hypothetical protein n=1 Tax=Lactiplantibacillus plantarum TaxID=1590 RepID=UPI00273A5628|nr:hypothetical protein [Lactiplantibacillus plantarum]MDP4437576.1 hypothetical protein [Lactiplantibacillus plantarum]MDP4459225.1 hypothetical protein [Lactiplantibacillus plantarum]
MIYDISIIIMLALFLLSFVVFVRWILKKIFGFNIHNLSCIRVAFISLLSGVLIVGLGYQLRTSDQKRIDEQNESKVALESKKKTKAKSESKAASESKKRARAKSESKAASESKKRARAKSESKAASESKKRARAKSESKAALESKKRARAKSESKAASENKKRARAKSKSEVSSAKKKKKQHSDTYQNIETIFNMHTIKYLSNRRIFNKGSAVALRDFKVIDFGADKMKQYHVLIAPKNASKTYFLLVFGDNIYKGRITYSSKITVLGSLNGKSRVNDSQINSGIAQRYLGKRDILVLIDRIQVKN